MERAFAVISADEPDEDIALLVARLAIGYWFSGDLERAAERSELALDIAEAHAYPQPLAIALRAKAAVAESRGHAQEAEGLQKQSLAIALAHDLAEDASTTLLHPLGPVLPARSLRRGTRIPRRGADALAEAWTSSIRVGCAGGDDVRPLDAGAVGRGAECQR